MRIQETDRILKESRSTRHAAAQQHEKKATSSVWRAVSSKLKGARRKH
jgi:hypothetical protein